jgi:hypothetical protein
MTWSVRPRIWTKRAPRGTGSTRAALPLALLLTTSLLGGGLGSAPAAHAASCEIPAAASLPRLAATPSTAASGSSIIQIEGEADAATPVSLPVATPVAPAPDSLAVLTTELTAVSESLASCLSAGDAEAVTDLAGERYLGQIFGSSVPLSKEDYVAIASELRPVPTRILSLEEVAQAADDRATAIVTQVVGNQLMRAEWTFTRTPEGERPAGRSDWQLSSERPLSLETPPGATSLDVEIRDYAFSVSPATVEGPDVVLRGDNTSSEDHEMLVLKLDAGYTTADLLRAAGPDLPEQAAFIGEIPVRAGHEQDLVLIDLEPGTYTLICLFPNDEGLPHLALGMEASFTVE